MKKEEMDAPAGPVQEKEMLHQIAALLVKANLIGPEEQIRFLSLADREESWWTDCGQLSIADAVQTKSAR